MAVKYNPRTYKNNTLVDQIIDCKKNGSVTVRPGQTVTVYDLEAGSDPRGVTIQDFQGDGLNLTKDGKVRVAGIVTVDGITSVVQVNGAVSVAEVLGEVAVVRHAAHDFDVIQKAGAEFTVVQKSVARTVSGSVAVSGVGGTVEVKPKTGEKFTVVQDSVARTVSGSVAVSGVTGEVATKPAKSAEQNMFHTTGAVKTLTASYVAGDSIDLDTKYGVLHLFCQYTPGAAEMANSVQIIVETQRDGNASWFQLTNNDASLSLMEYSFTMIAGAGLTDAFTLAVPIGPCDNVRISAKESGVAANFGTLLAVGILGW